MPSVPESGLPKLETAKQPSPVKLCILKSPEVVIVPPVAVMYVGINTPTFDSLVNNQPLVSSMNTNTIEALAVLISESLATP